MDFQIGLVIAGLFVGFIVGMTGVGGGSLMTPILLWFGIPPTSAVGTDLLYAAFTKIGGVYVHNKKNNINWKITGWLSLGSVPAALITLWILNSIKTDVTAMNALIKYSLGWALLFTSIAILFKNKIMAFSKKHAGDRFHTESTTQNVLTITIGVLLGATVTLTSIGAGALGTVTLFFLYPLLPTPKLVGTEIAHAVPLTLVAGIGHASMGSLDLGLLGQLLLGSLPGIYMGSMLSGKVPDLFLRNAIAVMLFIVGYKLVF
ncbi:sulfite exporter TauE/SafE family protein [Flavobacterium sp. MC2016-06]|uniref:sulfite exporter TauE/SafE family protein n=1 Tax=Flavobacterium sp. MC2016-06 TaxID=2676308 RepID=UPI0012BAEB03|nr:sulfite exporter TauE/SafE family protein [Flavobacterium sp. MC2016-06]MBU3858056.1 sulfite exporter TauE/SafE family protein [Flavobacterium sp. MC2016-06]